MIFKSEGKQSDLNGFLDSGSNVTGELRFQTSFRVDGKFNGTVISDGELIVGQSGEVDGDLRVGQVVVSGTVRGSIRAARRIHLSPTGKLLADIDTPSLVIEDGGFFEGRCSMVREEAKVTSGAGPKLIPQKLARGEG
jgi:cytoskeletal protein CcmA (bactofilin family)